MNRGVLRSGMVTGSSVSTTESAVMHHPTTHVHSFASSSFDQFLHQLIYHADIARLRLHTLAQCLDLD